MPGTVDPRFQLVRDTFEEQLAEGKHVGVAVAVYHKGEPVVDLWSGLADQNSERTWREDTICVVFSTRSARSIVP